MYKDKKVLLIAGGGTLGTYTAEELIRLGAMVDVLCPEDKISSNDKLTFIKGMGSRKVLKELLSSKHYDGIINFIHYPNVEEYKAIHNLLSENTKHLIFLSSYRVYADEQHPVTESAPMLLDVSKDKEFLEKEDYALSKAKAEYFLRNESNTTNWTIVRPVISFSQYRFDIVTINQHVVLEKAKSGETLYLPEKTKNLVAALDWAGNSGKLIANLLFKKEAFGEAYTISSAQNLTWGEVAEIYIKLLNVKIQWVDIEEFIRQGGTPYGEWALYYDRLFDRRIDNSKVLKATGLTAKDFKSVEEGIKFELDKLGVEYMNSHN